MSFQAFSRKIAQDFLQTVVVVDDNAFLSKSEPSQPSIIPGVLEVPFHANSFDSQEDVVSLSETTTPIPHPLLDTLLYANSFDSQEDLGNPLWSTTPMLPQPHLLNAKVLIDSFAEKGLVCAVLRPEADEVDPEGDGESLIVSKTYKAAIRTDLLILDWHIHGYYGDVTKRIIQKIVIEDIANERLRFISIYTGEPNLVRYLTDVADALDDDIKVVPPVSRDIDNFQIQCGPVIITIYGKRESLPGTVGEEEQERFVTIDELPQHLINTFTVNHTGLLPNIAFAAVAAIRESTHKILNKFHASLDPAYLTHRAMITPTEEAEEHITDFLADEINSILSDEEIGNVAGIKSIQLWIDQNYNERLNLKNKFGFGRHTPKPHKILKDIFSLGYDNAKEKHDTLTFDRKRLAEKLAGSKEIADNINKEFAILTTNKTFYKKPNPHLTLGSVLKRKDKQGKYTYWLCLQPRCDSVRIKETRAFPLLFLKKVINGGQFQILVNDSEEKISLFFKEKAYEMSMVDFRTNTNPPSSVKSYERNKKLYFPSCEPKVSYQWIGHLKTEQAQRIANRISSQFSRVGLNESEWFRLKGPLPNNDD